MDNQELTLEQYEPVVIEHRYSVKTEQINKDVIRAFIRKCGCETVSEVLELNHLYD
jgi:hypothetical protein